MDTVPAALGGEGDEQGTCPEGMSPTAALGSCKDWQCSGMGSGMQMPWVGVA